MNRILEFASFRLLNSEIGNDHLIVLFILKSPFRFRLLNSEIGNDQVARMKHYIFQVKAVFVSLTRR